MSAAFVSAMWSRVRAGFLAKAKHGCSHRFLGVYASLSRRGCWAGEVVQGVQWKNGQRLRNPLERSHILVMNKGSFILDGYGALGVYRHDRLYLQVAP